MAKVIPFRGIFYNPAKVSGDEVIAPPYDIITPEYREVLYQKSPYNIVRIDFGKEFQGDDDSNNRHTRAKDFFEQWIREGVFVRDEQPSFYAYEIDYNLHGETKRLRGILAMVKIEELGRGVYPHEATHSKPKADRLNLMRACLANISPIYSLYNSPEKITTGIIDNISGAPYISAKDMDGATHKLYKISEESKIDLIIRELSDKAIFIADGHHRYEVALEFKKEMGEGPWEYVLMFLANMADHGIAVLPTHRMVKGIKREDVLGRLEPDFAIQTCGLECDIVERLSHEGKNTFGLYLGSNEKWYILKYKGTDLEDVPSVLRSLDVVVLHELIIKKDLGITDVAYEMDITESIKRVRKGDFDAVFFLNPTGVNDVEKVALSGLRMPPKSTYFYPKLLTGMVINKFIVDE
ncbi:MAG: DUF1015 domain-containing protein [Nitrospiraceae bacterium]|nr:DUF1015 domain-containing protein [Nitrospiraceae bacterium]